MSDLDQKSTPVFAGKVVRKDLVRKVKVGANVPVFVLEYLLGKYCATDDPAAIDAGLRVVNSTISSNFVRPDEANKVQSLLKDKGKHTLIDKVKVRYLSDDDKHWAELVNFGHKFVHIPEHYLREFDRLLMGGIWAQIDIRHQYDEEASGKRSPFWIDGLKPIQLATFDLDEYRECRRQFTSDEWIDLLDPQRRPGAVPLRAAAEAAVPDPAAAAVRAELQPRGARAEGDRQELRLPGTLALRDPADRPDDGGEPVLQHGDRQDGPGRHLGRGRLRRGGRPPEDAQGGRDDAQDLLRVGHVCPRQGRAVGPGIPRHVRQHQPARRRDGAVVAPVHADAGRDPRGHGVPRPAPLLHSRLGNPQDAGRVLHGPLRLRGGLPGGSAAGTPQAQLHRDHRPPFLSGLAPQRPGREGRPQDGLGAGQAALSRTASSRVEELAELVEMALEGRRRVKEQLKKMGSFEYHQTSFSYIDNESREERFVGVPEQGGRDTISTDPLAPGSVYAASVDDQGKVGLYRLEVGCSPGTGKLKIAGGHRGHDEGVDPAGIRLPSGPEGARWASVSRWTRPTSTSRRSTF